MKNYISINNQKIELTDEQISEIRKSFNLAGIKLADIAAGETFKVGKYEFIVLEHSGDTTAAILKNLLHSRETFGANNNYDGSNIDAICNKFAEEIANIIGADNLVEHTVDLTANDGLRDYGKIRRCVSLLTANLYRRYVEILDKYKLDSWWWLATAYSAPKHNHTSWVLCESPSGGINFNSYNVANGVRPFCIFDSSIFVSCEGLQI